MNDEKKRKHKTISHITDRKNLMRQKRNEMKIIHAHDRRKHFVKQITPPIVVFIVFDFRKMKKKKRR